MYVCIHTCTWCTSTSACPYHPCVRAQHAAAHACVHTHMRTRCTHSCACARNAAAGSVRATGVGAWGSRALCKSGGVAQSSKEARARRLCGEHVSSLVALLVHRGWRAHSDKTNYGFHQETAAAACRGLLKGDGRRGRLREWRQRGRTAGGGRAVRRA